MSIFVEQSNLRIQLTCVQDITDAIETEIRYRKPDGTEGAWDAEVEDEEEGIIYYDLDEPVEPEDPEEETPPPELDQAGIWTFWVYVKFSDGRTGYGEAVQERVYPEGEG